MITKVYFDPGTFPAHEARVALRTRWYVVAATRFVVASSIRNMTVRSSANVGLAQSAWRVRVNCSRDRAAAVSTWPRRAVRVHRRRSCGTALCRGTTGDGHLYDDHDHDYHHVDHHDDNNPDVHHDDFSDDDHDDDPAKGDAAVAAARERGRCGAATLGGSVFAVAAPGADRESHEDDDRLGCAAPPADRTRRRRAL